jgi:hypothetical protein
MRQSSASGNAVFESAFAHELTFWEWAKRFDRHLARVSPDLTVMDRLWTSAHWLTRWHLHDPEGAAEVSVGWWASSWSR